MVRQQPTSGKLLGSLLERKCTKFTAKFNSLIVARRGAPGLYVRVLVPLRESGATRDCQLTESNTRRRKQNRPPISQQQSHLNHRNHGRPLRKTPQTEGVLASLASGRNFHGREPRQMGISDPQRGPCYALEAKRFWSRPGNPRLDGKKISANNKKNTNRSSDGRLALKPPTA